MNAQILGSAGAITERERATRDLFDSYSGPLFRYVLRLVQGDRSTAEDIVQEALLRCWRKRDILDLGDQDLRPWLFTVARNLAFDSYRARKSRALEVDEATAYAELRALEEDGIDALLSSVVVRDALQSLTMRYQEVLHQIYYLGRTTQEAADALGIPQGTVKSRVYYAHRALKDALCDSGYTAELQPTTAVTA